MRRQRAAASYQPREPHGRNPVQIQRSTENVSTSVAAPSSCASEAFHSVSAFAPALLRQLL